MATPSRIPVNVTVETPLRANDARHVDHAKNTNVAKNMDSAKHTPTSRIGVGRHQIPDALLDNWSKFTRYPPPKLATSAELAKNWSDGAKTGGKIGYAPRISKITNPNEPKCIPGAGGIAGHVIKKPTDRFPLYDSFRGWNQS